MIPKIIHQTWVGKRPPPWKWINSWKEKNPGWLHMLWNNERIQDTHFENQEIINYYLSKKDYPGAADVIRYEVLYRFGGFNPGADSECVRPLDDLFENQEGFDAFSAWQDSQRRFVIPLQACTPGNEFARMLIDGLIGQKDLREPWRTTGNLYMTQMVRQMKYNRLKIFPNYVLVPKDSKVVDDRVFKEVTKVYAIHHWGTTTDSYKNGLEG